MLSEPVRRATWEMRALATETGGLVFFPTVAAELRGSTTRSRASSRISMRSPTCRRCHTRTAPSDASLSSSCRRRKASPGREADTWQRITPHPRVRAHSDHEGRRARLDRRTAGNVPSARPTTALEGRTRHPPRQRRGGTGPGTDEGSCPDGRGGGQPFDRSAGPSRVSSDRPDCHHVLRAR